MILDCLRPGTCPLQLGSWPVSMHWPCDAFLSSLSSFPTESTILLHTCLFHDTSSHSSVPFSTLSPCETSPNLSFTFPTSTECPSSLLNQPPFHSNIPYLNPWHSPSFHSLSFAFQSVSHSFPMLPKSEDKDACQWAMAHDPAGQEVFRKGASLAFPRFCPLPPPWPHLAPFPNTPLKD